MSFKTKKMKERARGRSAVVLTPLERTDIDDLKFGKYLKADLIKTFLVTLCILSVLVILKLTQSDWETQLLNLSGIG